MSQGPLRPSRTALQIARSFALLKDHPSWSAVAPKGSIELTKRIVDAAVVTLPALERFTHSGPFRVVSRLLDRGGPMQGGMLHLALRKRWFDDEVRRAIAEGFTQVVVIGAGYDSLAYRLAQEFPNVLFFEVDTRPSQHEKYKALKMVAVADGRPSVPSNLDFFVVDLAHGSVDRALLSQKTADASRPTLFIAEGVIMYLDEANAKEVLRAAARVATPRSRLLFSYLATDSTGKPHAGEWGKTMSAMLKIAGEPFRFAIGKDALSNTLRECGLELIEQIDERGLVAKYLPSGAGSQALLEWEYLASAERA